MDEAGRIIGELQQKLQQLDHRVCLYRRDMTSEYSKYAENLLRDVPEDVSKAVSVAMLESLKSYPSLFPEQEFAPSKSTEEDKSLASTTNSIGKDAKKLDEAAAPVSEPGVLPERPRSPHEREKEFQGLFTPSYLPLLDSSKKNERRSSMDSPPETTVPQKVSPTDASSTSASGPSAPIQALKASPELAPNKPPIPVRKNTDTSISSDHSDSPRRSALRKGSLGSIKGHSPRRVRFDFEGEEVLPTTSPEVPSYISEADQRTPIILGYSTTGEDSSDDEACSQQVEDVAAAAPPPPKRISSSQALRTLSRGPVEDDGTKWTEVVAPPDGSPSIPADEAEKEFSFQKDDVSSKTAAKAEEPAPVPKISPVEEAPPQTLPVPSPIPSPIQTPSNGRIQLNDRPSSSESQSSSQRVSTSNPTTIPGASSVSILSPPTPNGSLSQSIPNLVPTRQRFTLDIDSPTSSVPIPNTSQKETLKFNPDEDDILFDFDDDASEPEGLEAIGEEDESTSPSATTPREQQRLSSTSNKENAPELASSPARTIPTIHSGSYIDPSYKGTKREAVNYAFKQPVVNKDMHSQAERMGPVSSFIGSLDGRSGVDASDIKSYRGSGVGSLRGGARGTGGGSYVGSLRGGVPGSFSERLMMEEMESERS